MSRFRVIEHGFVCLLLLSLTVTQATWAQDTPWQTAKQEAVTRGIAWIRVAGASGELVNWSTSLAGLVLLGQHHTTGASAPLGYRYSSDQDQALLDNMARYVVDSVIQADPQLEDIRATAYGVSFLNQFLLTGGPDAVNASVSVSQALRNGIMHLLAKQNTGNEHAACARGGWVLPNGTIADLWYTHVVSSALSSTLRNVSIQDLHVQIAEGLELTADLLRATTLNGGGWALRPCSDASIHLTSTAALLHLNTALNESSVEVQQRQSLSQLAQSLDLVSTTNENERYHEMLWAILRMKQTLVSTLTAPPYFVWTPVRTPEADGYSGETPSLEYDIHYTLMTQQNGDGTFPCQIDL